MMKKTRKTYIAPETKSFVLKMQYHLLQSSPDLRSYDDNTTDYIDDDDDIL